ncbi:MAG: TRIC cation channel family protein [Chloroflexia bacterium]|nr:TRIC cation channel family protein [Chloroflexia bacterium]
MVNPWSLFDLVDLFGVFVGAFSGALVARRHGYDITRLWGVALVAGLGGGLIRDLCPQVGPPLALTELAYLPVVAVATLADAFYRHRIDPRRGPIVFADSVALIGFAVAGSLRTINYDFGAWSTV